ncbi:hypothetical protein Sste5346_009849 [Sporothrix stenoceras]|uniref:Xylanolytic transcriptional activator regulatory domain-containing protein n=1 Tax=Sporothrix stenoceras TaxID=5173 RepID=A0ABR3YJB5_9PEZI
MNTDSVVVPDAAWPQPQPQPQPASQQPYQIRRIRQACATCRSRMCVYESYSYSNDSYKSTLPTADVLQQSTAFHQRLSTLETALDSILQQDRRPPELPSQAVQGSLMTQDSPGTLRLDCLPPADVLLSLMETYFTRVHNRPYAFFHERTFMENLRAQLGLQQIQPLKYEPGPPIFSCVLLAVCAFAVRFSPHPAFAGRTLIASDAYSRAAWRDVMENHLESDAYQSLQAIQCVGVLTIVDYTAGQVSAGWLRLGLAIRMAQEAGMMQEPPATLPPIEREARRRTCWSIYIVDRLISCAKSRPSAIWETDCLIRLPSDPLDFGAEDETGSEENGDGSESGNEKNGLAQTVVGGTMAESLDQLLNWHTGSSAPQSLGVFGLTILMVSVIGRCARYMYGRMSDHLPPWDPKSEAVAIRASLARMEQLLRARTGPSPTAPPRDAAVQTSRIIYTHCMFHLCHCLLNHPFLLRKRLQATAARIPTTFIVQSFSAAEKHACKLTDLLDSASAPSVASTVSPSDSFAMPSMVGTPDQLVESSIFAYGAMIAAGIHTLSHGHNRRQLANELTPPQPGRKNSSTGPVFGQYDTNDYFLRSRRFIQCLEPLYPMVVNIEAKLDYLVLSADFLPDLFDTTSLMDELDAETEEYLWSITDYGALARLETLTVTTGGLLQ